MSNKRQERADTVPGDDAPTVDDTVTAEPDGDPDATGVREIGGRDGPEPTRFGDWEKNGRCIDF